MFIRATGVALLFLGLLIAPASSAQHWAQNQIHGRVESSGGGPAAAAEITVRDWTGALVAHTMTDGDGRFTVRVRGQGPFQVNVNRGINTQSATLDSTQFTNFVMRLHPITTVATASPADTVSLNELLAPKSAKQKLAKAEKAMHQRRLKAAAELANEAVAAAPEWGRAHMIRGVLSLEDHHYQAAETDLKTAVRADPKDPIALTELGKLYSETGRLQESEAVLRRALALPPVTWPTYYEMANLAFKQHRWAEAEKLAFEAEFASPAAPPVAMYIAGLAAYNQREFETTRQQLESYITQMGEDPRAAVAVQRARDLLAHLPASVGGGANATPAARAGR